MFWRMLYNPLTEYAIAATGLSAVFLAQEALPSPQNLFNVISMGGVVAILLWMQHAREQRQSSEKIAMDRITAEREQRLLGRIEKLECGNDEKLMQLIERQMVCSAKTDTLLIEVEKTMSTFNHTIQAFVEARPCLAMEATAVQIKGAK